MHFGCSRRRPCCGSSHSRSLPVAPRWKPVRAPPAVGQAVHAPERRAGAAPGLASLAHGPHKQAADPRRASRALRKPGRALRRYGRAAAGRAHTACAGWARFWPGSHFQFKISFSILYSVSTEFKLQKCISKYP
jgi:hypothetical protein